MLPPQGTPPKAASHPEPARSKLTPDYQRDWPEYYAAVQGKPVRDTLLKALSLFEAEQRPEGMTEACAIDIACGSGRDTHELLRRGWRVWATDSHPDARKHTVGEAPAEASKRLRFVLVSMEELLGNPQLPPSVQLINASFALPFCQPERFPAVWNWIEQTLTRGGRFAGQFFGDRDEWQCVRPKSHFTRRQIEQVFATWEVEELNEVEKEGDDATGKAKYHHVFHIVARKKCD